MNWNPAIIKCLEEQLSKHGYWNVVEFSGPTSDLLTQISQGRGKQVSFKKPSRWFWWMLKFETQNIRGTSEPCRNTDQRITLPSEQVRKAPEKRCQMSWPYWTVSIVRNPLMTENQIPKGIKRCLNGPPQVHYLYCPLEWPFLVHVWSITHLLKTISCLKISVQLPLPYQVKQSS